jgi:hypothetical protein
VFGRGLVELFEGRFIFGQGPRRAVRAAEPDDGEERLAARLIAAEERTASATAISEESPWNCSTAPRRDIRGSRSK